MGANTTLNLISYIDAKVETFLINQQLFQNFHEKFYLLKSLIKLNSFGLWRTMGRGGACCGGDEAGDKVEYDPANGDYRYHNL